MGTIYLKRPDGSLAAMRPEPYDAEAELQALLAEHPHLLLGEDPDGPGWLVRKEAGVPDAEGAPDRWSLDHLFVDAEGVPTLVEVKRSTDTRIRREVVGQMLDYAANGVRHWPEGSLQAHFAAAHDSPEAAEATLIAYLDGGDPTDFWAKVEDNLRAGRIRMVFAADHIPATLQRIVEFLNEQCALPKSSASRFSSSADRGRQLWSPQSSDAPPRPVGPSPGPRGPMSRTWQTPTSPCESPTSYSPLGPSEQA